MNNIKSHQKLYLSADATHAYVEYGGAKYYPESAVLNRDHRFDCLKPGSMHIMNYHPTIQEDVWVMLSGKKTYVCADQEGKDYIWIPAIGENHTEL